MESCCRETKLLIETLTEEFLTVAALRESEFDYLDESDHYPVFGYFGPTVFCCKELNAFQGDQEFFRSKKLSIGTLMDEMKPVVL